MTVAKANQGLSESELDKLCPDQLTITYQAFYKAVFQAFTHMAAWNEAEPFVEFMGPSAIADAWIHLADQRLSNKKIILTTKMIVVGSNYLDRSGQIIEGCGTDRLAAELFARMWACHLYAKRQSVSSKPLTAADIDRVLVQTISNRSRRDLEWAIPDDPPATDSSPPPPR